MHAGIMCTHTISCIYVCIRKWSYEKLELCMNSVTNSKMLDYKILMDMFFTLTVYSQRDSPLNGSNISIIHRAGKDAVVFSLSYESNPADVSIIWYHLRGSCCWVIGWSSPSYLWERIWVLWVFEEGASHCDRIIFISLKIQSARYSMDWVWWSKHEESHDSYNTIHIAHHAKIKT